MSTSKMKFRFKLTGLEIEMEGTREEVGHAATAFTNQLTNMLKPKALNEFQDNDADTAISNHSEIHQIDTPKKRKTSRSRTTTAATKTTSSEAVDMKFDSEKYGVPKQAWKGVEKALWILYVAKEVAAIAEMSNTQIVNTFNKHFKQAGTINKGNVPRDLGIKKLASPSLVGEDATHSPAKWFLTDAGIRFVQDLILAQKSGN